MGSDTASETNMPSDDPTAAPTFKETTTSPTDMPTDNPTVSPTVEKTKAPTKNQQGKNKCAVLGAVFAKIKTQRHGVIKARRIAKVPVTVNTLIPKNLSLKAV